MKRLAAAALFLFSACEAPDVADPDPTITGGSLMTAEDVPLRITLGGGSPSGLPVTFQVSSPSHGVLVGVAPELTYVPAPDFHGEDYFLVMISDGVHHASSLRRIVVTPMNDPPVMGHDEAETMEDTPLYLEARWLLDNDVDVDFDNLRIMSVENPVHGDVELAGGMIRFVPERNYLGASASFEYVATDGMAQTTARVTISVGGQNDAPDANDDTWGTPEDTALAVPVAALTDNDVDPDSVILVTGVANPTHGQVTLSGGVVTFTPDANFHGVARFEYTVSDGELQDGAEVLVVVDSVNDAPDAGDDALTTAEDVPAVVAAADLVADDSDPDGPLSVVAVGDAAFGEVSLAAGLVTFVPDDDFVGQASFRYVVSDGEHEDEAVVVVTVTPVNDAPVAADDGAAGSEDAPVVVSIAALLGNDHDLDGEVSFHSLGAAQHGSVARAGDDITFTPDPDFAGEASFVYTVTDGELQASATVQVTLAGVNDAPVASAQSASSIEGADVPLTLEATDVEGSALSFEVVSEPQHGTITGSPPSLVYTPEEGYAGSDQLNFRVFDGQAWSNIASVTFTVTGPPGWATRAPVKVADGCTVAASPRGGKIAADADGRVYVLMTCAGDGRVTVSQTYGASYAAPVSLGLSAVSAVAVAVGPSGVAYVAALAGGELRFTRTQDGGATWDAPVTLAIGIDDDEISIATAGDQIWIAASPVGRVVVWRNSDRGDADWAATDTGMWQTSFDVMVDGDTLWVGIQGGISTRFAYSTDGGSTFTYRGFFHTGFYGADFAAGGGRIVMSGANADFIYRFTVPDFDPVQGVWGLPSAQVDQRAIAAAADGTAYVVSADWSYPIHLNEIRADSGPDGIPEPREFGESPRYPGVTALPEGTRGAAVLYDDGESDDEVWVTIQVYPAD